MLDQIDHELRLRYEADELYLGDTNGVFRWMIRTTGGWYWGPVLGDAWAEWTIRYANLGEPLPDYLTWV